MKIFLIAALMALFATGCSMTEDRNADGNADNSSKAGLTETANPNTSANSGNQIAEAPIKTAGTEIETIYTDLAENKCKDVDSNADEAWSVQSCGGVAGYDLLVSEGDLRQTIDVVAPDKKKYELNLWSVVSSGFSTVGDKAEWRIKKVNGKVEPFALIVRYNVNENPENTENVTSYLTVSKIIASGACVTDIVKPARNANDAARKLADDSHSRPCLKNGP